MIPEPVEGAHRGPRDRNIAGDHKTERSRVAAEHTSEREGKAMIPEPVEGVDYHVEMVEWDALTGERFDCKEWTKAKLIELELNDKGEPLRPHEKTRPPGERTLFDFMEV